MAGVTFKQIEQDMRSKIRYGKWTPGALLPSRRDLAKEYGVTCVTVQRAIASLLHDGTVRAHPRKGTFVSGDTSASRSFGPLERVPSSSLTRKKLTLGLVAELPVHGSPRSDGSYFETRIVVQAVEHVSSELALTTRFVNVLQPIDERLQVDRAIESLLADRVDGIVIAFSDEPDKVKQVYALSRRIDVPIVYVSSRELAVPLPHVYFDNRDAGFQAAQHLLDQGCTTLTLISPYIEDWGQERALGIKHAISAADLPDSSFQVCPRVAKVAPWNMSAASIGYEENKQIAFNAAYECSRELFATGNALDGIVAASDHVAFGVLQAALEFKLLPGRDFLIVGFDDVPDARLVNLSTLRPPLEWMGREAANLLLKIIQGRQTPKQIKLRSHLVTRASTCRVSEARFDDATDSRRTLSTY